LMAGPWEVPELEIRERPPSMLRNVYGGPPGGAEAGDSGAQAFEARPSGRAVNDCRNIGTDAQRVVRTYFTLTKVGYFC
jgi:hypothetical protein